MEWESVCPSAARVRSVREAPTDVRQRLIR